MKIAVISDTHVGDSLKAAPDAIWEMVDMADCVIHLGDFTSEEFADELERRSRLYAVSGNADGYALKNRYPATLIMELGGGESGARASVRGAVVRGEGKG